MRRNPLAGLLAALGTLALGGCGTYANLLDMDGAVGATKVFRVYGGARLDLEEAEELRADPSPNTPMTTSDQLDRLVRRCYLLGVDLPVCCVLDTLTLPLTATAEWESKVGAPSGLRSGNTTQTYVSPVQASATPDAAPPAGDPSR